MQNLTRQFLLTMAMISAFAPSVAQVDTVRLTVHEGWNLISLPVEVVDPRKSVLFPTAISDAFTYNNGYERRDTLQSGVGYWLKFAEADTVTLVGSLYEVDSVEVNARWNLIGAPGFSLATTKVTTVPESLIVSDYYEFDPENGYSVATTLEPGKGYWVKTESRGKLIYTPWEYVGLPNLHITALAVADSMTIYAATQWGMYKTTNAGVTWDTLLPQLKFLELKMHPTNTQVLYATLGGTISPPHGILKTTDGGANWFFADSGIFVNWEVYAQTIEFDPLYPETLYAGTAGFGAGEIYKTTNGGMSWFSVATNDTLFNGVWTIAVHPETTSILFAGNYFLLKTTNGGEDWFTLKITPQGYAQRIADIVIDNSKLKSLYIGVTALDGGLLKSTDYGNSWFISNNGLPSQSGASSIIIHQMRRKLFAGIGTVNDSDGLFESTDEGTNWARTAGIMQGNVVTPMVFSPGQEHLYICVVDYPVFSGIYRKRIR